MNGALWNRLAAACGAVFWIGILIGDDAINGAGEAPNPIDRSGDSLGQVSDYLSSAAAASTNGSYWVGRSLGTLALISLLVFSAFVGRQIRIREGDSGILGAIAMGSGAVAVGLGLLSAAAQFAVVARANEGIDLQTARAMLDFSGLAFVLMWLPLAAFMAAVAVAGIRYALLPRWLAIATTVLAIALAAGLAAMSATPAGYLGIMLATLWFTVTSVVLARTSSAKHSLATD